MKIHDIISEAPVGIIGKTLGALLKPHAEKAAAKAIGALGHDVKGAGGLKNAYSNFGKTVATPVIHAAKWTGYAASALKFFGLYQTFMDYNEAVKKAEANLKSGKYSQEQYEYDLKRQKTILVTQIAIALPGFLLVKITSSWSLWCVIFKNSGNPLAKAAGTIMATMATGAQAGLIQLLRDKDVVNLYAEFIAGSVLEDLGQATYDKIANLLKSAESVGKNKPDTKGDASSAGDKDSTSTTPDAAPTAADKPPSNKYVPNSEFAGVR